MDIIIEIGDQNQRKQIEEEMKILFDVFVTLDQPIDISKIIVPANFQDSVNLLQNRADFQATRGNGNSQLTVMAKVIELDDKNIAIVLSPNLFTTYQDTLTRYFTYLHEVIHVVNKRRFPQISTG